MKTSEFIKRVEELGYETDKNNLYIYIQYKRSTVAIVSLIRVNTMDTLYGDASNDLDLFNLIVEYAKTPLEDREEPKRYYELLNELGVKEEQWVPEYGERYWYVMTMGDVNVSFWNNDVADNCRLLMNNVFKTEDEAGIQRYFDTKKSKTYQRN